MKKVIKYIIIKQDTILDLQKEVNSYLVDGDYTLYGNPFVFNYYICQALVLLDE